MTPILAGDVGGTKTVIGAFEREGAGLRSLAEATYASSEHSSLDSILQRFLADQPGLDPRAVCVGVAGPVVAGRAKVTNLPWELDAEEVGRVCDARAVLVNDLFATAHGVLDLAPDEAVVLHPGRDRVGNMAVIAAGTGLGVAFLVWDGERHHAVASEGGHAGFAPRSEEQIELLRFLREERGDQISTERVLSGPGLHNIYRFARQRSRETEPLWVTERLAAGDPAAAIAQLALEDREPVCAHSLELFVSIYGAEAGDLALCVLAVGGVVLAGGIAPKIRRALEGEAFGRAFVDKGRFRSWMNDVPVSVALDPRLALRGAARIADGL